MYQILLFEDDLADQLIFKRNINKCEIENNTVIVGSILAGKEVLNTQKFDFIFCDYNLPDGNAIDFLESSDNNYDIPIIVLTSHGDISMATESLKKGAFDFITKDNVNAASLDRIINNVTRSIKE